METPQAILGADGTVLVARMIHAAAGRCAGLHFGTYDYSASVEIAAATRAWSNRLRTTPRRSCRWRLHERAAGRRHQARSRDFYRSGLPYAAGRLRAYRERRCLGVLDELATATALARYLAAGRA
ncbi:MAG: hypothetical protein M3Y48_13570 [Actinomycetota bacterium]|nr:hypothetical protein [Actinomycetota bacterium]